MYGDEAIHVQATQFTFTPAPFTVPTNRDTKMPSTEKIKSAVITTVVVLATIYAMNQLSFSKVIVQKALNGE